MRKEESESRNTFFFYYNLCLKRYTKLKKVERTIYCQQKSTKYDNILNTKRNKRTKICLSENKLYKLELGENKYERINETNKTI